MAARDECKSADTAGLHREIKRDVREALEAAKIGMSASWLCNRETLREASAGRGCMKTGGLSEQARLRSVDGRVTGGAGDELESPPMRRSSVRRGNR